MGDCLSTFQLRVTNQAMLRLKENFRVTDIGIKSIYFDESVLFFEQMVLLLMYKNQIN
jgi:hypothetical protein